MFVDFTLEIINSTTCSETINLAHPGALRGMDVTAPVSSVLSNYFSNPSFKFKF